MCFFFQHNSEHSDIDFCMLHQGLCAAGEERICINRTSNCSSISPSLCLGLGAQFKFGCTEHWSNISVKRLSWYAEMSAMLFRLSNRSIAFSFLLLGFLYFPPTPLPMSVIYIYARTHTPTLNLLLLFLFL